MDMTTTKATAKRAAVAFSRSECPASKTGSHDIDLRTLRAESGYITVDEMHIDVTCSACGTSATAAVMLDEFDWDEPDLFHAGDWFAWDSAEGKDESVVYARVIATGSLSDEDPGYEVQVFASAEPRSGVPGFYTFRYRHEFVALNEAQVEAARKAGWPDSFPGVREALGDEFADKLTRIG